MAISCECDRGQHEDCGGNGDMFGCGCDCHLPEDPELAVIEYSDNVLLYYLVRDQRYTPEMVRESLARHAVQIQKRRRTTEPEVLAKWMASEDYRNKSHSADPMPF